MPKFSFSLKGCTQCCVFLDFQLGIMPDRTCILLETHRTGDKEGRSQRRNEKKSKGTEAQGGSWPWEAKPTGAYSSEEKSLIVLKDVLFVYLSIQ